MPTLVMPITSNEQLENIYKAEDYLRKAGISFDTGHDIKDGQKTTRCWELDWSLNGAKLKNK